MRPVRHGAIGTEVRIGRHEIVVGSASPTKSRKARDQPAMARRGGRCQRSAVRLLGVGEAEFFPLGTERPHQVAARVLVQVSRADEGRLVAADAADRAAGHLLDRDKQPKAAACGDEADAVEQRPRDPIPRDVEENFAGDADHTGLDALRIGQKLPAHARAAPVCCYQNVALRTGAVLEIRSDATAVILVALEGLAEMHIVELRQQHLAQCDAARGAVACDRIGAGNEILRRTRAASASAR